VFLLGSLVGLNGLRPPAFAHHEAASYADKMLLKESHGDEIRMANPHTILMSTRERRQKETESIGAASGGQSRRRLGLFSAGNKPQNSFQPGGTQSLFTYIQPKSRANTVGRFE